MCRCHVEGDTRRDSLLASALSAVVDGGSNGLPRGNAARFAALGLAPLVAGFVGYLGLRVAYPLADPFPYVRWTGIALFVLAAAAIIAATVNGYATGDAFVSPFIALAPVLGVFVAALLVSALGWARFDAAPLSVFGPVAVGMAVLGFVAFLVGRGARAVFG